jgi:hypothetical protein
MALALCEEAGQFIDPFASNVMNRIKPGFVGQQCDLCKPAIVTVTVARCIGDHDLDSITDE